MVLMAMIAHSELIKDQMDANPDAYDSIRNMQAVMKRYLAALRQVRTRLVSCV
jgi:hypothetical protein